MVLLGVTAAGDDYGHVTGTRVKLTHSLWLMLVVSGSLGLSVSTAWLPPSLAARLQETSILRKQTCHSGLSSEVTEHHLISQHHYKALPRFKRSKQRLYNSRKGIWLPCYECLCHRGYLRPAFLPVLSAHYLLWSQGCTSLHVQNLLKALFQEL